MTATQPSSLAAPSLYLSNWQDLVCVWQSHALSKVSPWQTPGIRELHYLARSADEAVVNQIVDWTGFFRDETGDYGYTDVTKFESSAWFESSADAAGTLTTNYLTYNGAAVQPRCALTRSYVAVPRHPLVVVRYQLTNLTDIEITFNILDQLHPANSDLAKGIAVHASYDANRRLLIADLSATGQPVLGLGAFVAPDGYQAGDDTQSAGERSSAWHSFNQTGTLPGNGDVVARDVDVAFNLMLAVPPNGTAEAYLYLTVGPDVAAVQAQADVVRGQNGAAWFTQTAQEHTQWLAAGVRPAFVDDGLNTLFDRSLIMIKHAQNPALGPFVATTNPVAYQHLSWMRDSAITAIALDASGHHDESGAYWSWMAGAQEGDGTFRTRSCVWDGAESSFVAPEYDSVGQFLYGVARHFDASDDRGFLTGIWPRAKAAADWILDSIASANGLGAADHSIWEEDLEYNAFTQGWYVAGLYCAQRLAEALGDSGLADWYAGGPGSIITAIQRRTDTQPPGLWNANGFVDRGLSATGNPLGRADSSSNIIPALGILDPASGRAAAHVATMLQLLTRSQYGLARYLYDDYYFDKPYDPAGDEAGGVEPSWPQMSMWVAVCDTLTGQDDNALRRLQWFASTSGMGYMPQGEAVSNITGQSVMSSLCEPLTASSFLIAALTYLRKLDPRPEPPIRQAGCNAVISVSEGTAGIEGMAGDLPQWDAVPYFVTRNAGSRDTSSIARCWVANDDTYLFVRVDNSARLLSSFATDPKFALHVYSDDLLGAAATISTGLDAKPLSRPAAYALQRTSDGNVLERWTANSGHWRDDGPVNVDIVPQWDPTRGSIEAKLPLTALCSAALPPGNAWCHLTVAIAYWDEPSGSWIDDGRIVLHYRLTSPIEPAIYGNLTQ